MFSWLWPIPCIGCGTPGARWCPTCCPGPWLRPAPRSEGISHVFSLTRYDSPAGHALKTAKVQGDRATIQRFARTLARRIDEVLPAGIIDAVVPAPSTRSARSRRGFSTAAVLAGPVARALRAPVRSVLRTTATTRLAKLDARQRRQALRGRIRAHGLVAGTVVLLDDVVTSGATAEAAAMELLGGTTDRVLLVTCCAVDDLTAPSPL